jgi:uncharacterized protein (DUF433 family)
MAQGGRKYVSILLHSRQRTGMDAERSFLGVGLYTVAEASHLTHVSPGRIRRWMRGYAFPIKGGSQHTSPPLWREQVWDSDGELTLTFRDLIEIRFVDAFRKYGVSWRVIRGSSEKGAELLGVTHPFSSRRFKTDGQSLFITILQKNRDKALLNLSRDQMAFRAIVEPLLVGVQFSAKDDPLLWRPLGAKRHVVIDPSRSFGQPITTKGAVPTRTIAAGYRAERSFERVARWYGIPVSSVRDAVEFEDSLDKAA